MLGLLEGEAKGEILTLYRTSRNIPKIIFDTLLVLDTEKHSSLFPTEIFSCRQEPASVRAVSRLKQKETHYLGGDLVIEQFIMDLREGIIYEKL